MCSDKGCCGIDKQCILNWECFLKEWNKCFVFACDQCNLLIGYAILIEVYYLIFGVLRAQCGNCKNVNLANQLLDITASSMCKLSCNLSGTDIRFYLIAIANTFAILTRGGSCGSQSLFNITTFIDLIFINGSTPDSVLNPNIILIPLDVYLTLNLSAGSVPPLIDSLIPADASSIYYINPANLAGVVDNTCVPTPPV
jgi:hypothetical protein